MIQTIIASMLELSTWMKYLFPPSCIFCHASSAHHCCHACAQSLHSYSQHHCFRCGFILSESLSPGPCGHCLNKAPPQQQSQSLYVYEDAVRLAILNWKLHGQDAAIHQLLTMAQARLRQIFQPNDLLLPIPAPLTRMRQSGIHHSADLCKKISHITQCQWDWRYLRRQGQQPRQSELSGKERRLNLRRAFCLSSRPLPENIQRIWILDDVMTTGSTLHHAAKTAVKYPYDIHIFSLARVL
ncbi:MAG: double zinc ribbon domain-containing protein [Mariprofundaceae bacterium]|nr:double zinc ribbon domain-containing protein [Mariprofundaceae bacterium]